MLNRTDRVLLCVFLLLPGASPLAAEELVPFKGTFQGQTVSAAPTNDPAVIFVVTEGDGEATHLGRYTLVSPHFSHLDTLFAEGAQIFTAANGDVLTADFAGQFVPSPDGFLLGELEAVITGGTGRFAGATGRYTFHILFDPATFTSIATINGEVSAPNR